MSIQLMIVVLYVAMLFAISFYVKRRAETSATEYQFAGRKFGALLIAVSVTGMAVGAASTVGVAESATRIGPVCRLVQWSLVHRRHLHGSGGSGQVPHSGMYNGAGTV